MGEEVQNKDGDKKHSGRTRWRRRAVTDGRVKEDGRRVDERFIHHFIPPCRESQGGNL